MLLVAAGRMNKQVAGDIGISEITTKIHRGAAMRKIGTRTVAEVVRIADVVTPKRPYIILVYSFRGLAACDKNISPILRSCGPIGGKG